MCIRETNLGLKARSVFQRASQEFLMYIHIYKPPSQVIFKILPPEDT